MLRYLMHKRGGPLEKRDKLEEEDKTKWKGWRDKPPWIIKDELRKKYTPQYKYFHVDEIRKAMYPVPEEYKQQG